MELTIRREHRPFVLALAVSLALHALLLFCLRMSPPAGGPKPQTPRQNSRIEATLQPQAPVAALPQTVPHEIRPRILTAKPRKNPLLEPAPAWTARQRDEMDQFLNELSAEAKPRSGRELAQRAMAMARTLAVPEQPDNEQQEMLQKFANANVEPFSIEMYFDALFKKMNRSAAMISQEQRSRGHHVAAVRIVVNKDGTVKNFRVLWAADQQEEIAFIKAVVDSAAPFPVFPQDIRNATDSIVLQICIVPNGIGGGSGATFARMAQGQTCQAR